MIVRSQTFLTHGAAVSTSTGPTVPGVVDDADVVVFITGQQSPDIASTNYEPVLNTSAWNSSTDSPVIERSATGSDAVRVSYAVVEFTGINWFTQRVEHRYVSAGTTETEAMTAVNSLTRTFIHASVRCVGN